MVRPAAALLLMPVDALVLLAVKRQEDRAAADRPLRVLELLLGQPRSGFRMLLPTMRREGSRADTSPETSPPTSACATNRSSTQRHPRPDD